MASVQKPKSRPYRDFLTPSLHRQFTHAAAWSFALCYLEACLMSNDSLWWRFLPAMTGIRSLLLFISAFVLFLLRVANKHVGTITSKSPIQSTWWEAFSYSPIGTVTCYTFSAWFFSEVYLSSLPSKAKLGLVDDGGVNGRAQLNERAVFFRTQLFWLPCIQTLFHLAGDYNKLDLPLLKPMSPSGSAGPKLQLYRKVQELVVSTVFKSLVTLGSGTFLYLGLFRHTAWNFSFALTKYFYFWTRNSGPKGNIPSGILDLIFRTFLTELALLFMWDWTNTVLSAYIAEPPLKKGRPLTDDSKDPNGSLLSGLRAKKQFAKTMAFWELSFISQGFENRRKSIYQEIDRNGGSTWSQLLGLCLNEIKSTQTRIRTFRNGPAASSSSSTSTAVEYYEPIATQPSDNNIISPAKPATTYRDLTRRKIDNYIKSKGSHPGAENPAKQLIERGATKVIERAKVQPEVIRARTSGYMARFLRSPAGSPFRQTFPRLATSVVCGSPYSRSSIIIDAISAISKLAAQSITEDQPGQVQKDIPALTRALADALSDVEGFLTSTAPHWTDVEFHETQRRSAVEVEAVVNALRSGIEDILRAFGEYFGSMGVSAQEVKRWRTLVGRDQPTSPDMAEARN